MTTQMRTLYLSKVEAPWKGIRIGPTYSLKYGKSHWYLILFSRHGKPIGRRMLMVVPDDEVEEVGEIDISHIKPKWLEHPIEP